MIEKIIEPILLKPAFLKANTTHCKACNGIGWLYDKEKEHLVWCKECGGDGLVHLCIYCGNPVNSRYFSIVCGHKECIEKNRKERALNLKKKREENEKKMFKSAQKISYEECPEFYRECLFLDSYSEEGKFFEDFEELFEWAGEKGITIPEYVWATNCTQITLNARDMVSNACEELWEEAYYQISEEDIKELQEYLDEWCKKQTGTMTYTPNYNYAIKVPKNIKKGEKK